MHYSGVQIIILVNEISVFTCLKGKKPSGKVFQVKDYACLFKNLNYNNVAESTHSTQQLENWFV